MARGRRNYRRDNYGRYKGKGGIKPWKNNNPNYYRPRQVRKGSGRHNATSGYRPQPIAAKRGASKKKKVLIGALVVGAAAGTAYGVHKYRESRLAPPRKRVVNKATPGLNTTGASVTTGAATSAAGSAIPRRIAGTGRPKGRIAGARTIQARSAPMTMPVSLKSPSKINAKSILTTAAAVGAASAASVRTPDDDDVDTSKDRWVRIERARQAGIPAAASFIDGGGTDSQIREAERKKGTPVSIKPTVVKSAPVHSEKQQAAKVERVITTSFKPAGSAISLKPKDYGMVNEKGNTIRIFPQTKLRTRPATIGGRQQRMIDLNKQYGRPGQPTPRAKQTTTPNKPKPDSPSVQNQTAPVKPIAVPSAISGTKAPSAPKPRPAQKSVPQGQVAPSRPSSAGQKVAPPANGGQFKKLSNKEFEKLSPPDANKYLRELARQKTIARGSQVDSQVASSIVKITPRSQASIFDGGAYKPSFAEPEKKQRPRRNR